MAETGRKPNFVVRAKQSPDSEYWTTIGAAWSFLEKPGYAVRLHVIPVMWTGEFILVPPKDGVDQTPPNSEPEHEAEPPKAKKK